MITIYIPGLALRNYEFRRGDAQIIHDDKKNAIVIDGGEADLCNKLIAYCRNNGITHITYILTHWHVDHDSGMKSFLDVSGICVDHIYCPPPAELKGLQEQGVSDDYNRALRRIAQAEKLRKVITYPIAGVATEIVVGDIRCRIWRRKANKGDKNDYEINNTSLVTYFPDIHYLTSGDTINSFDIYLNTLKDPVVAIKIPHHGNACTTAPCEKLKAYGCQLAWYNDFEPSGTAIGGTGFSKWGAGYCKKYFTTLRTDVDIWMIADAGKLTVTKGSTHWTYDIPYNKGHWQEYDQGWKYIKPDGTFYTNGAYAIEGKWYYFDADGYRMEGWILDPNDKIYRYCRPYMLLSQFITVDGKTYYLDGYGRRISDKWYEVSSKWYAFDENGVMRTGWYTDPELGRRYLEPTKGYMYVNTVACIDGKDYSFDGYGRVTELATQEDAIFQVINIARAEVGYKEKASNKDLDSKTANAGSANYTKYGRDMHSVYPKTMDFPAAWCDAFVDWCFYRAFGKDIAPQMLCGAFDDYTVNSAGYYKSAKRWYSKPEEGDQIFFKDSKGICHTGLVYKVDSKKVYTIEGNKNNAVRECSYSLGDSSIAGYGRPKWELAAKGHPAKKSINEIAKEVIAGKWGVGEIRKQLLTENGYDYAAVQAEVNRILKS